MMRFPAGRSSTSTPASASPSSSALRLDEPQPALAAGKQRRGDLLEVLRDGSEGLREPALDRLGELRAQPLELLEAPLEVLALRLQVGQPLLLGVVLLLGERVHLAERRSARLEPLGSGGELVAIVALGGLCRPPPRAFAAPPRSRPSRRASSTSAVVTRSRRLLELLAQPDLRGAEPAELVAELAGSQRPGIDPGAERSIEPLSHATSGRRAPSRASCRLRGCARGSRDRSAASSGRAGTSPRAADAASARSGRLVSGTYCFFGALRSSSTACAASSRRRASSSSRTASAVSPANHSSRRAGS